MSTANETAGSPYVTLTSDKAEAKLMLEIAHRFKGIDPAVDQKIDEHASLLAGKTGVRFIPAVPAGAPKVPMYLEGEPGVGKTSVIVSATKKVCAALGLNFVDLDQVGDSYVPGPLDCLYVTVNLSGKNNPSDIGGLPSKGELAHASSKIAGRVSTAGEWLSSELESRARALGKAFKLQMAEPREFVVGNLVAKEMVLKGAEQQVGDVVVELVKQMGDEVKNKGAGITVIREGDAPQDGHLTLQIKRGAAGQSITVFTPPAMDQAAEYVAEMLPNRRFALAHKARFGVFNFDDVANASEAVRNVLLQIAQSGRYSGVADIGNAMVTFTGNMGSEDNTNTQSEQSDAELTRVRKFRVMDTPADWARRMTAKYSTVGDCFFASFVSKYGNDDGVFRDAIGDGRTERGIPKPNSRSLENALKVTQVHFQMANASSMSPSAFLEDITDDVKATAGANVASRYVAFVRAMLTEAVPMAESLIKEYKFDEARFSKSVGAGVRTSESDFKFRYAAALADAFVDQVCGNATAAIRQFEKEPVKFLDNVRQTTERMGMGFAHLADASCMNYALSRLVARLKVNMGLGANPEETKLPEDIFLAMSEGFAVSKQKHPWVDPEAAANDFIQVVAGANNRAEPRSKGKGKKTP